MAAHSQFNRIGNGFAGGERGAHAFVPHGDAIGDGDCGKFARGAAASLDAEFDGLCLTVQRDVTGCGFVPARRDANEGLFDIVFVHAHRVIIRTMRCAGWADRNMTAG